MTSDEFYRIQKFVAACRRQWPGAMIVLRPNQSDASTGAKSVVLSLNPHQKDVTTMTEFEDDTPTEADLDRCYGSKYLSAADVGNQRIRARIARIYVEQLQQQGGKPPRPKFVIQFTNIDKPMVLNATNKSMLVDSLGRNPAAWVNAEVGILVENTQFGGKPVKGLRLRVLNNPLSPSAPKPAPAPAPKPTPQPVQASTLIDSPWDDEVPGFGEAAE
jgi:hypothetical protein